MSNQERIRTLEQQIVLLERRLDRLAVRETTSMPYRQVRLARAIANGMTYPSTGNQFYVEFLDGSFPAGTGSQTATYTQRGEVALCHNTGNKLPDENSIVQVFFWSGKWWCEFAQGTENGGGSVSLVSAAFDVDGASAGTNQQTMTKGGGRIVWAFEASELKGGGGGVSWVAADNAFELDTGDWQIFMGSAMDIGDMVSGYSADASTTITGTSNGPPVAEVNVRLEWYDPDGLSWESLDDSGWRQHVEVGEYDGDGASMYRYTNDDSESRSIKLRITSAINGTGTEIPHSVRIYNKKWHIMRLST